MSDFQTKVEDLIGSQSDVVALADWLTSASREVFNVIPKDLLLENTAPTSLADGNGMAVANGEVFNVVRAGYSCKRVGEGLSAQVADSNSMHFATNMSPVFYVKNKKLYVKPDPAASPNDVNVYYLAYPSVAITDTSITGFPNIAEEAVVLGAAIRGQIRAIVDKRSSLPSTLNITNNLPVPPQAPSLSYSDASLNSSASGVTKALSGTAPTYVPPTAPTLDFDQVTTYVDTDNDSEMASSKLEQIAGQLNEYARLMQNALNVFNKANVEYEARVRADLAELQSSAQAEVEKMRVDTDRDIRNKAKDLEKQIQENQILIQQYTAQLQSYSSDVNKQVQQNAANVQRYSSEHAMMLTELKSLQGLYVNALKQLNPSAFSGGK